MLDLWWTPRLSLWEWISWELLVPTVFLFQGNHRQLAKVVSPPHSCTREFMLSAGVVLSVVEMVDMLFSGVGV